MSGPVISKVAVALFTLVVLTTAARSVNGAATIVILNDVDAANTGFNDPTPVAPVGNNTGTTLGQQRLNAFQFAANIWGATLESNVTITIRASWEALSCTSTNATLGSASAVSIFRDFQNAPFAGTWYPAALANALGGQDFDPAAPDIRARFNSNLGNAGCLDGTHFYLGLDNNHGGDVDLVSVLMHEFAHGLGFATFTSSTNGNYNSGFPTIYDQFLLDNSTGKAWVQMTNTERMASAISGGNLVWTGAQATNDVASVLHGAPRLRVNSPGSIAGNYTVGTADFGQKLSAPGLTANVTRASPTDGCSALTNGGAILGSIAVIDRGTCNFVVKVKNAQNAGAAGVIMVNNTTGTITMGGSDSSVTIPSVMISQADGDTIKGQLTAGVSATLLLDAAARSGVDTLGHALLFAPNPVQSGSSVSHWDSSLFPNQLMEPTISSDLTHSVTAPQDLTLSLLRDIGWNPVVATPTPTPTPSPNPIDGADFLVRQHYLDFLNRTGDASGLAFWTNEITSCGTDQTCIGLKRVNVSAAFYLSIEFQETGYLVERMYKSAYGDATASSTFGINPQPHQLAVPVVRFSEFLPDTQTIGQGVQVGAGNWQAQLEMNKQNFALVFVGRTRFANAYANTLAPPQFVDALFANAGIAPTQADRDKAIAEFGPGASNTSDMGARGRALRDVAENSTLSSNEFNRAFVLMQYFGYLRRNPNDLPDSDYTGYDFWLTKLNQFNGNFQNADMVKAFITSAEYRQRFGP